jgi:segregation and condensation protein A
VADKVESLVDLIRREGRARLSDLLRGMAHRYEMVCTFLALLELIRMRQIRAIQSEVFGDIDIVAAEA